MKLIWFLIILLYVLLTHLIAKFIGSKRKIGYGKSVLWSILFSPVIGFIVTSLSKKIDKQ